MKQGTQPLGMWGEGKITQFTLNEMKLVCKVEILVTCHVKLVINKDKHRIYCQEAHSLLGKTDIKK